MTWDEYQQWESETRQAITTQVAAATVQAGQGVSIDGGVVTVRPREERFVVREKAPWQASLFVEVLNAPLESQAHGSEIPLQWQTGAANAENFGIPLDYEPMLMRFSVRGRRGSVGGYQYVFPVRLIVLQFQPTADPDNTNYREELVRQVTLELGRTEQTVEFNQIGPPSFTQVVRIKKVERT